VAFLALLAAPSAAQVLGSCGTPGENEPVEMKPGGELIVRPIPLPGQNAINFELPAVIGGEIKPVKLSDYNGKWRVLCFYPADFTFV
jgi:peroxiredoxin (alkyl hydroperoxide reductase subunit C)